MMNPPAAGDGAGVRVSGSAARLPMPGGAITATTGLALFVAAYVAVCLAFAVSAGFRQSHNDYWDVYFIATHLEAGDVRSWFNPQYPIGYTLLLRGLLAFGGDPAAPAILLNIALSGAILWVTGRIGLRLVPPAFAGVAVVFLAVFFEFFRYGNAAGGDSGAVLFFTAGAGLALRTLAIRPERGAWRPLLAAGWLLGVAALFRYHALPAAALFGFGLWCAWPRRWLSVLVLGLGAAGAYSLQWSVNLAAGRGLLETQFGPMNVYDLMYGLNWHRITSLDLQAGVRDIIAGDPGLFVRKYLAAFWSFKQVWGPPLLAWAIVRDPVRRPMMCALAVWITAYFLLFSATTSGRQLLIPLPFSMLALGVCAHAAWMRFNGFPPLAARGARLVLLLALAGLAALHLHRDRVWLAGRAAHHAAAVSVESRLLAAGVTSSREVFTSDFDLYFRRLDDVIPFFNGGAPRLGTYRYNEVYPEFPVESPEELAAFARMRGVRALVLDADARKLSPAMTRLYEQGVTDEDGGGSADSSSHWRLRGEASPYRIFILDVPD